MSTNGPNILRIVSLTIILLKLLLYIIYRRLAVGDQLRAVYDGLARDPNSLANLDQDLPNYAQHAVPIHSLPQEWLWCETWCSDDSKEKVCTFNDV